jgi:hypothetical protein
MGRGNIPQQLPPPENLLLLGMTIAPLIPFLDIVDGRSAIRMAMPIMSSTTGTPTIE